MEQLPPLYRITFTTNRNELQTTQRRGYELTMLINKFLIENIGKIGCILSIERIARDV
jgi:hypothetical protein